jgi:hypothetical protein
VECRIQRAFGEVEGAVASGAQRFCNGIAVRRTRLHGGEQEQVEMALEDFGIHSSPCYASLRDVSRHVYLPSDRAFSPRISRESSRSP